MPTLRKSVRTAIGFFCLIVFYFCVGSGARASSDRIKEIKGLVRLQDVDPTIVIDLRYAAANNFITSEFQKRQPKAENSDSPHCFALSPEIAKRFRGLNPIKGFAFYGTKQSGGGGQDRPVCSRQVKNSDVTPVLSFAKQSYRARREDSAERSEAYLAGKKIYPVAVGVRVTASRSGTPIGRELTMPSGFDDFSQKATLTNPNMSEAARKNVDYLTSVMTQNGFLPYEHEWWHFDDSNWQVYPLVDVRLEQFLDDSAGSLSPSILQTLNKDVQQAMIVAPVSAESFQARLTTWKLKGGRWRSVFKPMDAVIGKNGLAPKDQKKEGDGRTPSGIYRVTTAFGYAPKISIKLIYCQVADSDCWVDDPQSEHYNYWVTKMTKARSFESLKRDDDLYKYGVVIEYNLQPVTPGAGNAIFLHIWRGRDQPTIGCAAVSEKNMRRLLRWLDNSRRPVIVLGADG